MELPQSEILIKTDNFNAKDKAVVVKSVALEIAQIKTKSMMFESDHLLPQIINPTQMFLSVMVLTSVHPVLL